MGEACPIRIPRPRPRTAVVADMATGRQRHAAIERTTPGDGIVPWGPSQADNPLFRLASKVTAPLGHLPAPLRNRVLLVLQHSTRPSKKAAGGIAVTKTSPGGVPTTRLTHNQHRRGTVVFLHGGAYTGGPFAGQWKWLAELHRTAGVAVAMVLYRMPPRHPHPAALDDTIRAITALHASGELDPQPGVRRQSDRLALRPRRAAGRLRGRSTARRADDDWSRPVPPEFDPRQLAPQSDRLAGVHASAI
jgi:hypothetical protein